MKVRWFDRFLMGLAPRWGARRLQARAAAEMIARHYDAAGGGRRTSGWRRSGGDANAANGPALVTLRELSRELRRNNGWARRGIQAIVNNTTGGWGIQPKATGVAAGSAGRAVSLWREWAGSTRCDFDGQLNFYGIQRQVMETVVESGEALVLRKIVTSAQAAGLPVPVQLRVVEPDLLDTSKDGVVSETGGKILQGIEFDASGRRVAYWIFPSHPGGELSFGKTSFVSQRVPAEDVLHIYRIERPGQARGVPWLASAIARLHDLDAFDDAVLMQQRIAACFAAFVTDIDADPKALSQQAADDPLIEDLEPGHISYLSAGKDVKFATPPAVTDSAYTARNIRRIAVSLGITYEELSNDYSMVNYSSARMARQALQLNVHDWRWNMLIPQLCEGVWRWVMQDAVDLRMLKKLPGAGWAPPPMPVLEPEKEGLANQRLVRSGVRTLFQVIEEQGEDPIEHLDELERVNKELDRRGLILDSDPRRTSTSGGTQQQGGGDGAAPGKPAKKPDEGEDGDE